MTGGTLKVPLFQESSILMSSILFVWTIDYSGYFSPTEISPGPQAVGEFTQESRQHAELSRQGEVAPVPVASFFHWPAVECLAPEGPDPPKPSPCRNAFQAAPGYLLPKVQSPGPWWPEQWLVFDREISRNRFFGSYLWCFRNICNLLGGKVRKRASWTLGQ